MNETLKPASQWTLITIDDPTFLTSESVIEVIKTISETLNFQYVITSDIEGNGKKDWIIYQLKQKENVIMKLDELLMTLKDIKQFEWGDFFLFKEYPNNWKNLAIESYPLTISQSSTTVRTIDNQYIYIYTPFQKVVNIIKKKFKVESVKTDVLETLDFPY